MARWADSRHGEELRITEHLLRIATILLGLWHLPSAVFRADGLPRGEARAEGFAPESLKQIGTLLDEAVASRHPQITLVQALAS
jgi:hypothetical protein